MTTLVTGAAGFLGAHVLRELAGDHTLIAFDIRRPRAGSEIDFLTRDLPGLHWVEGDITDPGSVFATVKKFSARRIFHAAALTHVPTLRDLPRVAMLVNVGGTLNVLEAARILGVERVVVASSISVYAPRQYEPMDEAHPVHLPDAPPSLLSYSASKVAAEAFLLHYWADHGVDAVGLRFSGLYGLGMRYPMYIKPIVEAAVSGTELKLDAGADARRDYVYVGDAARAVAAALTAPAGRLRQRFYNIATGHLTPAGEIASLVRRMCHGARIIIGPGIPADEVRTVAGRGILATDAAQRDLGFRCSVSIEEGLSAYIDSYRRYRQWCAAVSTKEEP